MKLMKKAPILVAISLLSSALCHAAIAGAVSGGGVPATLTVEQAAVAVHSGAAGQLIQILPADPAGDVVLVKTSATGLYVEGAAEPAIAVANAVCDFSKQWSTGSDSSIFCIAK